MQSIDVTFSDHLEPWPKNLGTKKKVPGNRLYHLKENPKSQVELSRYSKHSYSAPIVSFVHLLATLEDTVFSIN